MSYSQKRRNLRHNAGLDFMPVVDGQNLTNYKVKPEPKIKPYGSRKYTKGPLKPFKNPLRPNKPIKAHKTRQSPLKARQGPNTRQSPLKTCQGPSSPSRPKSHQKPMMAQQAKVKFSTHGLNNYVLIFKKILTIS